MVTSIDVCPGDGRLLALAGYNDKLRIFDKRESKIVKTFEGLYGSKNTLIYFRNRY